MATMDIITEISTERDLQYLIWGGAFLGSGGGGPINIACEIKEDILKYGMPIKILQPDALTQQHEKYGAVVAFMGSPEAGSKGIDLNTPTHAFTALEEISPNKKLDYALLIEIGAGNSLVPLAVAVRKQIPVVDGDGAGRAVPKIQNTSYAVNASACPAALSNGARFGFPTISNIIEMKDVLQRDMADTLENYALKILEIPAFGQVGGLAAYLLSGPQTSESIIPHTLSLSYGIGKVIDDALMSGADPISLLIPYMNRLGIRHYTFGEGEVIAVQEPSSGSRSEEDGDLDVGYVKLQDDSGNVLEIKYENENLFALLNGSRWAMAPDLICYIGPQGSLSNVEIKEGQRLSVVGIPANYRMRNPLIVDSFMKELSALQIYDGPYIPIERLHLSEDN